MNLKDKIVRLLKDQEHTYADLAGHLLLTEKQLDHALETKTLEIRTLELISKELRIPLYSFFRDKALMETSIQYEPYYNVNIWSDQEIKYKTEITSLKDEIARLRAEITNREHLIDALEGQLKKAN